MLGNAGSPGQTAYAQPLTKRHRYTLACVSNGPLHCIQSSWHDSCYYNVCGSVGATGKVSEVLMPTPNPKRNGTMKSLATFINVIAFSALFVAYASTTSVEKPLGVHRALKTYAGQLPTGAYPIRKSIWQISVEASDLV